jgi:hypothetical protein
MRLRFGEVTFDPDSRLLLRVPNPVHLTGKAFDLLSLLLKERPRALSKEELIGALWPDTLVTESNLTSLVNDVRTAIGDDARSGARISKGPSRIADVRLIPLPERRPSRSPGRPHSDVDPRSEARPPRLPTPAPGGERLRPEGGQSPVR